MARIRKNVALIIAVILAVTMTGCKKDKKETESSTVAQIKNSDNAAPSSVEIKNYEFPEFLNDLKAPDELSRQVYTSFDKSKYIAEVKEQPFDDYQCENILADKFYTFRQGKFLGLLNSDGEELVEATDYTDITVVSDGILQFCFDKERNAPMQYALYDEYGTLTSYKPEKFNAENIAVYEVGSDDADQPDKICYSLSTPDGNLVSDSSGTSVWDSAERAEMEDISTVKAYKGYFKVTKGSACYFICFDDYYNYTIYEGAYALVKIKVGNVYGECYILNHDDYAELDKMIDSFGNAAYRSAPSKDPSLDFIQITFGLKESTQTEITISSDGYCLTDTISAEDGQTVNKYFSYLDKEDFADLILWADQVLSLEYKKQ